MSQSTPYKSSCSDSDSKTDTDGPSSAEKKSLKSSDLDSANSMDSSSSDDEIAEEEEEEEEVETNLDQSISRKAAKNNLSTHNVRDIIKSLVSNDQVIAICKLRAEEIEKHREEGKNNFKKQLLFDSPEGIKLTRNKAKELNHSITSTIPSLELKAIEPDEEVVQLVSTDYHEDEDDEEDCEYDPENDEADLSDDYSTATCSDIESQPRTPGDALIVSEADDSPNKNTAEVQYDNDEGVFKVPGERKSPLKPSPEEMVAKRTRSQMSLTTTAIETIQKKFVHPDIGPDMYEAPVEMDVDEQPWQEFLQEFQNPLGDDKEGEEEEDNDPEYVAKNVAAEHTRENDWHIKVTKREVQVLIDELLEGFEESFNPEFPNELEIETLKASFSGQSSFTNTAPPPSLPATSMGIVAPETFDSSQFYETAVQEDFIPEASTDENCMVPLVVVNPGPTFAEDMKIVLASDNKLYLIPSAAQRGPEEDEVPTNGVRKDFCVGGWSKETVRIFQQQLLTHIQLAGQMFTQTYSHPEVWQMAQYFMDMLEDLEKLAEKESMVLFRAICWNLSDMLAICRQWKADLDVDSEENVQYVKDLVAWEEKWQQYHRFFPGRLAELWVTNRAFIFDKYLPKKVVNCYNTTLHPQATLGELKLLVLCLRRLRNKVKCENRLRRQTAEYYQRRYNGVRPVNSLMRIIAGYRTGKENNPVKAFYTRGEMPAIIHEEMKVERYEDVVPHESKPKYTLPIKWNSYVHGKGRHLHPTLKKTHRRRQQPPSLDGERNVTIKSFSIEEPKQIPESQPVPMKSSVVRKNRLIRKKSSNQGIKPTWGEIEALKRLIDRVRKKVNKCPSLEPIRRRRLLTKKLHKLLQFIEDGYTGRMEGALNANSIATKIFHYIKEFDLFVRLLSARMKSSTSWIGEPDTNSSRGSNSGDSSMLLRISGVSEVEQRDSMFAWTFIDKVKRRLVKKKAPEKFDEFLMLIKGLKLDEQGVEEFYLALEKLFLNDHLELVESLLEHLLPNHATQVGKFFQRLINQNDGQFRSNVKLYLDKRRDQMAAVYATLNVLSREEGTSMKEIKQSFLVVLSGNPLLESWFLQLFPDHATDSIEQLLKTENLPLIPGYLVQLLNSLEGTQSAFLNNTTERIVESASRSHKRKRGTVREKSKRRRKSPAKLNYKSPPEPSNKTTSPDNSTWTRDEDQLLFSTINGLTNCPEDKVLRVLFDTFPDKPRLVVEQRFRVVVNLITNLVK